MNVIHTQNLEADLTSAISKIGYDRLFVLTDETTQRLCWPVVKDYACLKGITMISIGDTDDNKTLESLASVWSGLQEGGASRRSLLINLGGGMVTDLGGFAASTFKRGIAFINIPTTLLSMVDASVGGKTGINFGRLKNEIGVFRDADAVIIDTKFLKTLDDGNVRSGYAEMLKHGIISDEEHLTELLRFDVTAVNDSSESLSELAAMVERSVNVKYHIVTEDPLEHGIRKALNLGHTVGHAFESFAMKHGRTVLHGYAVAWGLLCEMYLSSVRCGFPTVTMHQIVRYVRDVYGHFAITCDDYDELYALMTHDKKNHDGLIICTLMGGVGDIRINESLTKEEIFEMFDFFREG